MPRLLSAPEEIEDPTSLEDAVGLLARFQDDLATRLAAAGRTNDILRSAFARVREATQDHVDAAKEKNPLAFLQPSYEQCLKLNAWIWGYNFLCDFDANRIGKTAGAVFNGLFWIFPNDPTWKAFLPAFSQEWKCWMQVFQRPKMIEFLMVQDFLEEHPELVGDPAKPWFDEECGNLWKFCKIANEFPKFYPQPPDQNFSSSEHRGQIAQQPKYPAWPEPSYTSKQNVLWLGAPDFDYHRTIIKPEWVKWLPKNTIVRDSDHDGVIELKVDFKTKFGGQRFIDWSIQCKSYEAKDTKWSGAAVRGIVLTEGLQRETLAEIRQRFQADSFASWDYTPYEPRNTGRRSALAHAVYQRKEELPLRYFVFSGFGIDKAPGYILPARKRADLIRMWEGKPEGEARIHGKFFSSSPVALTNLDREFHTVNWTVKELFNRYPNHILLRSMDLGYDHPTVCLWAMLTPDNTLFIYRRWAEAKLSIGERVRKIVELSNNKLFRRKWGPGEDDYYCVEYHPNINSEPFLFSVADYHLFKTDEINKQPYIRNYIKEGLVLRPSTTMRPKDRANECNRILERSQFRVHPATLQTPGCKVFFLLNGEGIPTCLEYLENLFWARFAQGDRKGEPKDELQDHDDDDFDAFAYLLCSSMRYSSEFRVPRIEQPDQETLQLTPEEYYAKHTSPKKFID